MKQKNNSGISMLLVIAALLATGFIGVSLLKLATSDQLSGVYFSSSESARTAAKSGITKALAELGTTDATKRAAMLTKLNDYISTANPESKDLTWSTQWICGDHDTYDELSTGSDEQFKTRIVAFTEYKTDSFAITLESQGIGSGNSKSMAVGTYKLLNLGRGTTTTASNVPINALQMDNGNFEFNCQLTVDGHMSAFDTIAMNNGPAAFNGNFRLDPHRTTGAIRGATLNISSGKITGNAYFAGNILTNNILTLEGNAGFEGNFKYGPGDFVMNGDSLYLNGGVVFDGWAKTDLNGSKLFAYDAATYKFGSTSQTIPNFFTDYTGGGISTQTANLPTVVGVGSLPPKIHFDYATVLAHPHIWTIASETYVVPKRMNEKFEEFKAAGKLYKDKFLVIHFPAGYSISSNKAIWKSGGGYAEEKFKYKAIIIIEGSGWEQTSFDTEDTAIAALYIHNYTAITNTFTNFYNFRGFVYVNRAAPHYAVFITDGFSHYKGAVYAGENGKTKFDGGPGKHHRITFDPTVITELNAIGIFKDPSSTTTSTTDLVIKAPATRIQSELLGQAM